jgi:outer membrane receptor protein involved in Fe transport
MNMNYLATAFALAALIVRGAPVEAQPVSQTRAPAGALITGIVHDSTGGAIAGASVMVRVASGDVRQTTTDPSGRFSIAQPAAGPAGDVTLIVRATAFAEWRKSLAQGTAAGSPGSIEVVLQPARLRDEVTVTPTRSEQQLGTIPASVSVIRQQDIQQRPALVPDDLLRQLPEFSLFRRSNSVSAHPTSQGVSLRGIGPSGVSRSLVLLDGVPFNDAFGGWVYWTALPMASAERIEVVNGASSSLYGSYAMGGVLNVVTRSPERRAVDASLQYGSRQSPKIDFRASDVWGKVGVSIDGSAFDTDGYANVLQSLRGPVDTKVAVQFGHATFKADYNPNDRVHAFVRTGYFREERHNGKITTVGPLTEEVNDTSWTYTSGGVRMQLPDTSTLQATVFVDNKTFNSNFLAIPDATGARSIGRLSLNQAVPTDAFGGMVQWSRAFGGKHVLSAGTDFRWVDGDSIEDAFDTTIGATKTLHRVAGGTQRSLGIFVQDVFTPLAHLTVTASARLDRWRNYDAHNTETILSTGAVSDPILPDKNDSVVSPRLGALYRLHERVSVWGDIASGFRAPTLNELYRRFSQGAVVTLANPALGPERLVGGELGVNVIPARDVTWRTTWFDNRVKDPVANVTITPPNLLQRQNLGRTRIWGIQTDVEYRISRTLRIGGAYIYDVATVRENPANPALVGLRLPQVPTHRGAFQVQYSDPRFVTIAFDLQASGAQFDDDLNTSSRVLPKYSLVNLSVSRNVGHNLEVFTAVQNMLDTEYFVGSLPTLIGAPRLVSGGLKIHFQGRP